MIRPVHQHRRALRYSIGQPDRDDFPTREAFYFRRALCAGAAAELQPVWCARAAAAELADYRVMVSAVRRMRRGGRPAELVTP